MAQTGTRSAILELFHDRGDDFVSGEEISRLLGVSRTAVWKQIRMLREMGYSIEAVSSRGYRMLGAPDLLIPAEIQTGLETRVVGREVVFFEETDSTNLRASELGEGGCAEGTVVIADRQSAGKGRLGRLWSSPAGVNLYTSVVLRPKILPYRAPQLTFISAVAVAWAIEEVAGVAARVKWPNDVLVGGRKVAGLLNEMSAETEGIHFVILGIGVNLNMRLDQFPADLRYPATSLAIETGRDVSRTAFARALYRHLDTLYALYLEQGVEPVIEAWQELCDLVGQAVEVDFQSRVVRGVVTGLDEDGALLLQLSDGQCEKVLAGDVRPLAPPEE